MDLDQDICTGLLLMATAAGAPFLPKLAQAAKGNAALSVGLMVLLMVVTIIYMPIVLPLFLSGIEINPWDIARSLIVVMLIPLGIGLFMKARWPDTANSLRPLMSSASSFAILLLLVGAIIMQWESIVSLIGTGGILAIVVFLAISFVLGYLLGGSDPGTRSVMGLGTAQRNLSGRARCRGAELLRQPKRARHRHRGGPHRARVAVAARRRDGEADRSKRWSRLGQVGLSLENIP